jgi:HAD superfamily hydrolase (TIGR01509 family)
VQDLFISKPAEENGVENFDLGLAREVYMDMFKTFVEANSSEIVYPGAADLLKELQDRQIKVGVASSAPLVKVSTSLGAAGIDCKSFDSIMCEDTFKGPLKPDPAVFLKAAEEMGVTPDTAIVIEDASVGVQAAKKGGT